jgi:FtsH-binding integral membrane protein
MIVFGYILLCLGIIIYLFGAVRFLAIAYRHNIWWFLGCLFIPIVSLIFFLLNIRATAKPFGLQIFGILLAGIGDWMAGITLVN